MQAELERQVEACEQEVEKVHEEMKYFKLELRNREQNFNKVRAIMLAPLYRDRPCRSFDSSSSPRARRRSSARTAPTSASCPTWAR